MRIILQKMNLYQLLEPRNLHISEIGISITESLYLQITILNLKIIDICV